MAQTSFGWRGTVNELQWAQLASLMGQGSGLATPSDCRVTQVAGTRSVSVAAGSIFGDGVLTSLSSAETVALPTPTNGQWFLLVLNRVWSTKATTLTLRNGPTTATATSGVVPTSYPATFATGVGSNSDVPVAWLWGNSTGTAVTIVPILRSPASVQPRRGTTAQRDALYGVPTTNAAQVYLQGEHWNNTDTGRSESYSGLYDATTNPRGSSVAGWFGTSRRVVTLRDARGNVDNSVQTPTWTVSPAGTDQTTDERLVAVSGQTVTILQDGVYAINLSLQLTQAAAGRTFVQIGTDTTLWRGRGDMPSGEDFVSTAVPAVALAAGTVLPMVFYKVNGQTTENRLVATITKLA